MDSILVVEFGKLKRVSCAQDIAELIEDENTQDAQLQGATLLLEVPYMSTSPINLMA